MDDRNLIDGNEMNEIKNSDEATNNQTLEAVSGNIQDRRNMTDEEILRNEITLKKRRKLLMEE